MRISDWSSDVCSSDLGGGGRDRGRAGPAALHRRPARRHVQLPARDPAVRGVDRGAGPEARSEERRVGKECVCTCSSRWSQHHYQNNTVKIRFLRYFHYYQYSNYPTITTHHYVI